MDFLYHVLILICVLQRVNGLSLGLRNSCGVIGDIVFLDCSLDGATWNSGSNRQWRVSPPLTLLFSGGSPTADAAGYQEHISNAGTTGIFSLEITSLTWLHADKGFQCAYGFDTSVYTLSNTDIEDYKNTVVSKTEETTGLNIKGTITLDAIYPVPTVQAMLSSSNTDISTKALTNTTSPAPGNLTKVVFSVNHEVINAADYITVILSTPCGYSQSFRFNATDIETTTITKTTTAIRPSEEELTTGAKAAIVIGSVVFCVIIIILFVCIIKKKGNTYDKEDFASKPIQNPLSITNTTTKPPVKLQPLATKDKNHTPLDNTEEQNRKKKKKKQKQVHNKDETKVVHSDSEILRKQDDTTGTMNENHQPYGNDDMHVTKATHGKQETLTILNVDNEKNKTGIPYEKHETLTAIHIDNKKNKTGIAYEKHEKPTAVNIDNENNKIGISYEKHEKLTTIHIDNENNKTGIAYEKHEKPTAINIDNGKI